MKNFGYAFAILLTRMFLYLASAERWTLPSDVDAKENHAFEHTNHDRNTNALQTSAGQNENNVRDEFVVGDATKISFATAVARAFGGSPQPD